MKVQKRGTNSKRHTTHYMIGSKWRSRKEAVSLAEAGKVDGVTVKKSSYGKYIQSIPSSDYRLYDLEEKVMN